MRPLIIIESPFRANADHSEAEHVHYARRCMRHSITVHGEAPIASHLIYTQDGIFRDSDPQERTLGIELGYEWWDPRRVKIVFYTDMGWSSGMIAALWRVRHAADAGFEFRSLYGEVLQPPEQTASATKPLKE